MPFHSRLLFLATLALPALAAPDSIAPGSVFFAGREIYVKALLTHKAYDREEWKKSC